MVVAGFVGTGLSRVPSAKARLSHARCWLRLMPAGSRAVVKATGNAVEYSHPLKASYGVASPRRTKAYCLRRRALSETFGGWLSGLVEVGQGENFRG